MVMRQWWYPLNKCGRGVVVVVLVLVGAGVSCGGGVDHLISGMEMMKIKFYMSTLELRRG